MKSQLITLFLFLISCQTYSQYHTSPENVVLELFKAAQSQDFSKLAALCDPKGEGDKDVKQICNLMNQAEETRTKFSEEFKKGRIVGKTEFKENFASVKIKFGKDRKVNETVILVKRENFWYLYSM
jgi:hypothetical protein